MYKLNKPILCIISGIAGSGKTSLGEAIAQKLVDAVYLSKDLIQDAFIASERTGDLYEKISVPTLKILLSLADKQLSHKKTPIIDAPFTFNHRRKDMRRDWAIHFKNIAEKHNVRLAIIRCIPQNQEELRKRLSERGNEYDKWKLNNWDAFLKRDPIDFPISHDDIYEIITNKSPKELSKNVLENYLKAINKD